MAMDEQRLGKLLQRARQNAGLTQQQLCHKANLSFSTLTKIERGAIKSPSIFTVQAIANSLKLSLDELVGNQGPQRNLHKTKSGVSFVFFDVNGCLIYFYQNAFDKIAAETGARLDTVESAYWHFNDKACRGELSIEEFNKEFAKRIGVDKIDWREHYLATVEPIKEMQELLVWASENYRVGLLTNIMPGLLDTMIKNHQLPDINYDVIIDSSKVGAIKPDEKVYEIATERAGCPADEIMLIDDSRANLMAAERFDWHVLWFDDSRPKVSSERVREALEPA